MAMAVFVQDGECLDYTPGADVACGDVVVQNNILGVATRAILSGVLGAYQVEGVFDFVKAVAAGVDLGAVGTNWYWDNTAFKATKVSLGNTLIGPSVQYQAGGNGVLAADTTVRIKLAGTHNSSSGRDVKSIPITLAGLVNAQVRRLAIPFPFLFLGFGIRTGTIATTAAKLATITAGIAGVACTGGVASLTTVSNAVSGAITAATAITALNVGAAGDAIEFTVSAVTAFVEGDATIEAIIQRL